MAEIRRIALFGKLNSVGYKSIESATVFCKLRGNPYVELVHWLHQILQLQDSDLRRIVQHFALDPSRLAKHFTEALDRLPRGSTSVTDLSSHIDEAVERGWVYGSLMFGASQIRTGHLMVGILKTSNLRHSLHSISNEFEKIKLETLTDEFNSLLGTSPEAAPSATDGSALAAASAGELGGDMAAAPLGKQEGLRRFAIDLTEKARKGEIDPIVGRDSEIRKIVDILMRRRQNNPILTGEAGVGKTAVVEGFALRIVSGDVPPPLKHVSLQALDIGLLQAGASMKGEFESRLRQVIDEVQSSERPIILFIDEAHTLIGAGGASGTGDAANLLKPALARGSLRTIAATTWTEYKRHIEKDPALTRRFQLIQVDEPSEERAILMMRSLATTLEQHHRVQVLDAALEASVRLSQRYIPARQLPDKSVSLLDTACARVAISQHSVPPTVDDCRRASDALQTERAIIDREQAVGIDVNSRRADVDKALGDHTLRLKDLEQRWQSEKALVDRVLELRRQLRGCIGTVEGTGSQLETAAELAGRSTTVETGGHDLNPSTGSGLDGAEREALFQQLVQLQNELRELQGESPLILPCVDDQAVAGIVAEWTGVPVGRMVKNEVDAVLKLADTLNKRVVGQRHALEAITKRIQTSRARLDNPGRPIGVFLLTGPSGVGKTETALALAETLYGGEQNLITINMSEFQEAHTVSTLKGSPPGYVGYGEGGVLTEAVRRRPYSVVLLDEVEKAHTDVHEIFFQVFDKGHMEDAEGRPIDFTNTVILLTSNVGSDLIMNMCKDRDLTPDAEGLAQAIRAPLLKVFPPALLGRLVTVPFYPLTDERIAEIARLQLARIQSRISQNHSIPLTFDDAVVELIVKRCTELESGARMVDGILTNTLLPHISTALLRRMVDGQPCHRVHVSVQGNQFAYDLDGLEASAAANQLSGR